MFNNYIEQQERVLRDTREQTKRVLFATFAMLVTDKDKEKERLRLKETGKPVLRRDEWARVYDLLRPGAEKYESRVNQATFE